MSTAFEIIFCTCPDKKTAKELATLLVTEKLAACVNLLPGITSIYIWDGQVESVQEYLLLIKSCKANYQAIESTVFTHHPYEVPELIAVPIERGLPEYLDWIDTCLSPN